MTPYELNAVVKTQRIRLMDVFALGPFMVYAASLIPERYGASRAALASGGVLTILYNWQNYQRVKAALGASAP
jgi:hypothetical protein